jgi:hypothetical protein
MDTSFRDGFESTERLHLKMFMALTITEKIKAIEGMGEIVDFFNQSRKNKGPIKTQEF